MKRFPEVGKLDEAVRRSGMAGKPALVGEMKLIKDSYGGRISGRRMIAAIPTTSGSFGYSSAAGSRTMRSVVSQSKHWSLMD